MSSDSAKKTTNWKWKLISSVLCLTGFMLLILGVTMYFLIIPMIVESSIRQNSHLVENSRLMAKWKNPEYKIQFKLYVYSVKNPDEIMAGEIPEVSGNGPYVFDKKLENRLISAEHGIVKFKRYNSYYFNEADSCQTCILGNRIWVPNIIYQKFVEAASTSGMRAAATTLLSQTAFLEVEVGEFLFEGYKDPFLDKVCEIPFMNFVCDSIFDLPDRIGMFYEANNTADGVYEIMDGVADTKDLGKIVTWNGRPSLDESWSSHFLNYVIENNIQPNVSSDFINIHDIYVKIIVLPNYRLVADKALDFSQPPIMISLPNFHFATDEVKMSVKGMNESDPERDVITVDIEPRIGVVLRAQRRSQINVEMWKGKELTFPINLKKMRSSLIPVLVIHEDVEIDDDSLNTIKTELINTEWWSCNMAKLLIVIGIFALMITALLILIKMSVFSNIYMDILDMKLSVVGPHMRGFTARICQFSTQPRYIQPAVIFIRGGSGGIYMFISIARQNSLLGPDKQFPLPGDVCHKVHMMQNDSTVSVSSLPSVEDHTCSIRSVLDRSRVDVDANYLADQQETAIDEVVILNVTYYYNIYILTLDLKFLFPNMKIDNMTVSVINLTQKSDCDMSAWSQTMEEEREILTASFIASATAVCATLRRCGYWADFIDPSSGRPYLGKFTNHALFETDEAYQQMGFRIEDLGCCKVLKHITWGTHAFVGTLFTNAPLDSDIVKDIMKKVNTEEGCD
uniref:Protein croquemort n=1 Tax=Heterorhabditis bacteriophora TaxID=37862 RepID=A0A1I7XQY7_HETBA